MLCNSTVEKKGVAVVSSNRASVNKSHTKLSWIGFKPA